MAFTARFCSKPAPQSAHRELTTVAVMWVELLGPQATEYRLLITHLTF